MAAERLKTPTQLITNPDQDDDNIYKSFDNLKPSLHSAARAKSANANSSHKKRPHSSSSFKHLLYTDESERVPMHYSKPGPCSYEATGTLGKKSLISHYRNMPSYKICRNSSAQGDLQSEISMGKARNRFENEKVSLEKTIGFLNPSCS
jgi:hypothetical protein